MMATWSKEVMDASRKSMTYSIMSEALSNAGISALPDFKASRGGITYNPTPVLGEYVAKLAD